MSIDELINRSTIEFPKMLTAEETQQVFGAVAASQGLQIKYELITHVQIALPEKPTAEITSIKGYAQQPYDLSEVPTLSAIQAFLTTTKNR